MTRVRPSIDEEATVMITALIASVLGFALGWFVRNSTDSTRTRVVEELFSRKLHLADQQRDEAIKTLNANRVEMAGYAARFETLDLDITGLRESLANTERARASAAQSLAQRESEIAGCREAALEATRASEDAQALVEVAQLRIASAERAMDQAYDELMAQAEKLSASESALTDANARGVELGHELEQRELALADVSGTAARLSGELRGATEELACRNNEIETLKELAAGLAPLSAALDERDARLDHYAKREIRQLARIEELTPLADAFPGLRAECDMFAAHNHELEMRLALASAQAAELSPLREAMQQLLTRADSLEKELERERQRSEQHSAAAQAREEEALGSKREVARLEAELHQLQANADSSANELERARGSIERLNAASEVRDEQERASKHEFARMASELQLQSAQAEADTRNLERAQKRIEQLTATAELRTEEARAARRESARMESELQVTQASLATRQREVEKLSARIATLEAQLAERDERIKVLVPASRSQAARATLRPQPAKRPVHRSASDDLKRIAGIGPVLAGKLRRLGVASFDQLAALTRTDLEALAEKLGVAAERIRREGWISAARLEARARNGS